jgi:hypothetical protein
MRGSHDQNVKQTYVTFNELIPGAQSIAGSVCVRSGFERKRVAHPIRGVGEGDRPFPPDVPAV